MILIYFLRIAGIIQEKPSMETFDDFLYSPIILINKRKTIQQQAIYKRIIDITRIDALIFGSYTKTKKLQPTAAV